MVIIIIIVEVVIPAVVFPPSGILGIGAEAEARTFEMGPGDHVGVGEAHEVFESAV